MDIAGAKALKERIDRQQAIRHICKIFHIVDGKTVCVCCGKEME